MLTKTAGNPFDNRFEIINKMIIQKRRAYVVIDNKIKLMPSL